MLRISRRRPDGYHEIETLMQKINLSDLVEMELTGEKGIRLAARGYDIPIGRGNLAWKAAEKFMDQAGLHSGVSIRIEKRIPPGGGLGGGSSNCAAVLLGMSRLFEGRVGKEALFSMASSLGSDVPFFLVKGSAVCRGRGEKVEPLAMPLKLFYLLVIPPFGVSTRAVYGEMSREYMSTGERFERALEAAARRFPGWENMVFNDLEGAVFKVEPRLERIVKGLEREGLGEFRVSGSGSVLFRVFGRKEDAMDTYGRFLASGRFPECRAGVYETLERER